MPAPTEIKTERLLLRPFRLNGRRMTCTHTRKISEWSRFLPLPSPYEYIDTLKCVCGCSLFLASVGCTHPTFAVSLDDTVIGGINIRIRIADSPI